MQVVGDMQLAGWLGGWGLVSGEIDSQSAIADRSPFQGSLAAVQNAARFVELGSSHFRVLQTKMPHSCE